MAELHDPGVLDEIIRQVRNVENTLSSKFPWAAEDIHQEAWLCSMYALKYYDPRQPGAKGYFYRCAVKWVGRYIGRLRSVASITKREASHGVAAVAVPIEDRQDRLGTMPTAAEDAAAAREAMPGIASLRIRWRRAVERAAAGLPREVREVGFLAVGIDGEPAGTAAICRKLGMWREDVEEAEKKFRARMKRVGAVGDLERQIRDIEECLP